MPSWSDHKYCLRVRTLLQITFGHCFDMDVYDPLMAGVYLELSALTYVYHRKTLSQISGRRETHMNLDVIQLQVHYKRKVICVSMIFTWENNVPL